MICYSLLPLGHVAACAVTLPTKEAPDAKPHVCSRPARPDSHPYSAFDDRAARDGGAVGRCLVHVRQTEQVVRRGRRVGKTWRSRAASESDCQPCRSANLCESAGHRPWFHPRGVWFHHPRHHLGLRQSPAGQWTVCRQRVFRRSAGFRDDIDVLRDGVGVREYVARSPSRGRDQCTRGVHNHHGNPWQQSRGPGDRQLAAGAKRLRCGKWRRSQRREPERGDHWDPDTPSSDHGHLLRHVRRNGHVDAEHSYANRPACRPCPPRCGRSMRSREHPNAGSGLLFEHQQRGHASDDRHLQNHRSRSISRI